MLANREVCWLAAGRLIEVRYDGGLYLPEIDLWLDPPRAKPRAFVSHAHGDHFARHAALLCSTVTGVLIQRRFKLAADRIEAVDFHQPLVRDGFRLRMLPAGHIAGSAMLHVTRLKDGETLLYTGDFKVRRSRTAEPIGFLAADTLVMETTFGLPALVFPSPLEVESAILRFVHDALADGETPVLCGYSLGKAQELVAILAEHGLSTLQHPTVAAMTAACREAGVNLPEPVEFAGEIQPGQVVVAPPSVIGSAWLRGLPRPRTALATGWALQSAARYRYRAGELIPLSDHADHLGLLECIQRVRPQRVLTVHGFAREFAAELRTRGIDAWCAMGNDQLELAIVSPSTRRLGTGLRHVRAICSFADFSDVCRLVAETSSRVAQAEFLANYLRGLASDSELQLAVQWLASEALLPKPQRMPAAAIRRAIAALPGVRAERCHECFIATADPARAARAVLQETQVRPQPLDLPGVAELIASLAQTPALVDRIEALAGRVATLHPIESETLIRLLVGSQISELSSDTLAAALAIAFHAESARVLRARQLTGSWAETALLARDGRLADATLRPLVPWVPMRASPFAWSDSEPSAAMPAPPFGFPYWIEPDYRGVRAQLHKLGSDVAIFAADRQSLTGKFPELVEAARGCGGDFILDGVIVGGVGQVDGLERDLFNQGSATREPLKPQFIAFDLLWREDRCLTDHVLSERRVLLAELALDGRSERIAVAPVLSGGGEIDLEIALGNALQQGHSGLVIKDPASRYEPSIETTAWLRLRRMGQRTRH